MTQGEPWESVNRTGWHRRQLNPAAPPRHGIVLSALAVLVVLGLVGAVALLLRPGDSGTPRRPGAGATQSVASGGPSAPSGRPTTAGWRLESSLGLEIEVPVDWVVNNIRCNQTSAPSVVRDTGFEPLCATRSRPTRRWPRSRTMTFEPSPALPTRTVTVDGVAVQRSAGRWADGRYAGKITVPGRGVLDVRTPDQALTTRILDSLHLVDVDHLGCVNARPNGLRPAPVAGLATMVPAQVREIDVCHYGETEVGPPAPIAAGSPLLTSGALTGADAQTLADALNAGVPGRNPDSNSCLDQGEARLPDVVLLVHPVSGPTVVVHLLSAKCWSRGFDNGSRLVQVSWSLLEQVFKPLHTGFAVNGDLPGSPIDGSFSKSPQPGTT